MLYLRTTRPEITNPPDADILSHDLIMCKNPDTSVEEFKNVPRFISMEPLTLERLEETIRYHYDVCGEIFVDTVFAD